MIERYQTAFFPDIQAFINKEPLQNPYLYIDANTYGLLGPHIATYLVRQEGKLQALLYQYYNSLQLLVNGTTLLPASLLAEVVQFIKINKPVMISGIAALITRLKTHLPAYGQTDGHLFKYQAVAPETKDLSFPAFQWAHTGQDFKRLASFITSDSDIGSHYTVEQLTEQLLERHEKYGCQNVFLENGGDIIAHGGTYACYQNLAVIGGILTAPSQRGKGIARQLVSFLSNQCMQRFNQQPVLFCYNPTLFKFYNACGYQAVYNCSKLEFIGETNA